MSLRRLLVSTELRWSLGLLVFSAAPIVCVYRLYEFSQDGKVSIHNSTTLRDLDPQQATKEQETKGFLQKFGPRAAAEQTDKILTHLFGPPEPK